MSITLTKSESTILAEAAAREGGQLIFPEAMKPATRQRLLGRLEAERLIASNPDGEPVITSVGYRAIGLKPPRKTKDGQGAGLMTKVALIHGMLGRPDGATIAELMAATGWLPHTTRAALSRIRSAGQALDKSQRPDGANAYRLVEPPAPEAKPSRRKRASADARAAA